MATKWWLRVRPAAALTDARVNDRWPDCESKPTPPPVALTVIVPLYVLLSETLRSIGIAGPPPTVSRLAVVMLLVTVMLFVSSRPTCETLVPGMLMAADPRPLLVVRP